ncbi:hypothetical protein T12_10689 [Trichinella patagoniensis]|uniref:Uncharacterized protein n=1 Tax=Trichinella patagoniensis TaxID=990121 RepID=A0A0V0Z8K2_9BILA|nr:hypothetical protein T12_10689 [Trichinella patagoniensis]
MEHVIDPTRYSNCEKLLQLNTFYLCFIHYAQAPPEMRETALELTDVEVKAAEKKWIKHVARETKEFS